MKRFILILLTTALWGSIPFAGAAKPPKDEPEVCVGGIYDEVTGDWLCFDSYEARVVLLEKYIQKLESYLTVDGSDPARPVVRVAGANFQVMNGADSNTANGVGNLIVGYDDVSGGKPMCSNGFHEDESSCLSAGNTWAESHKTGSHNVVIGDHHNYSSTGGLVAGEANSVTSKSATVIGGSRNVAASPWSSISGGADNTTRAGWGGDSILGGSENRTTAPLATIAGGSKNTASGQAASVSGGSNNNAAGDKASVSGGSVNRAMGYVSSVSGGSNNYAMGDGSSVSGGETRETGGDYSWVAGGLYQEN